MNIYLQNEIDFSHNGLGFLTDILNVNVTDNLNGDYSLFFEYKINGQLSEYIENENIIKCKVSNGTKQLFVIKNVVKTFDSIQVNCRHIFYKLLDNFLEDVAPTNLNCQTFLQWILDRTNYSHKFKAYSDISTSKSARYVRRNPVDCILGDTDNSIVNLFGGEIKRDNFDIYFNKRIGTDNGVKLIIGKNITGINITIDTNSLYTKIMPQGYDGLLLPEKYVDSPLINAYPNPKIKKVEFSDIKYDPEDENAYHTQEEAYVALRNATNQLFENGIDKPVINVKIDWIELSKTNEYKNYSNLERVDLGDTITIDLLNITYKTRVIKTIYNPLTEKIDSFELGIPKANIGTTTTNLQKQLEVIPTSILENAIISATEMITKAMGGYVYKTQNELFIMDTNDPNTATKIWRWNMNGLGYSSNGIDGPYETAITSDGKIVADFVSTGKLNTSVIEGFDTLVMQVANNTDNFSNYYDKTNINQLIQNAETGVTNTFSEAGGNNIFRNTGLWFESDEKLEKELSSTNNQIEITDALERPVKEFKVYGKSEQETRSGKNLLNITLKSGSSNGITYTYDEKDNVITLNGTCTAGNTTFGFHNNSINFENGKTKIIGYYVSGTISNYCKFRSYNSSYSLGEQIDLLTLNSTTTKTKLTTKYTATKTQFSIRLNNGSVANNFKIKLMITNSDDETYEPYGVSPSPDYPSEIKSVKGITNLFNNEETPTAFIGANATKIDKGVRITQTLSGNWRGVIYRLIDLSKYVGKTIRAKADFKVSSSNNGYIGIGYCDSTGNNRTGMANTTKSGKTISFVVPKFTDNKTYLFLGLNSNSDGTGNVNDYIDYTNVIVTIDNKDLSYKPSYVPFGHWLQIKDTGKNLFDKNNAIKGSYYNKAGKIDPSGNWYIQNIEVESNKQYVISGNNYNNTNATFVQLDKNLNLISVIGTYANVKSFITSSATKYIGVSVADYNGTADLNTFQIEKGSTSTDYEPYKETTTLVDMNKSNLFDKNNANILNALLGAGGTLANANQEKTLYIKCLPNTTYTISKIAGKRLRADERKTIPTIGSSNVNLKINDTGTHLLYTTSSNGNYLLVGYMYTGGDTLTEQEILDSIKICEGTKDYYDLCSVNGTKDELEVISGKGIKKIGEVVLTGDENWLYQSGNKRFFVDGLINCKKVIARQPIVSNYFKYLSSGHQDGIMFGFYTGDNKKQLFLYNYGFTTTEQLKAWLKELYNAGTPVIVQYELETPQEFTLKPTEMLLNEGINNLTLIEDVKTDINVKYETGGNYEFWNGKVYRTRNNKSSNTSALLLQNNILSQEQNVPNGNYTVSFKYKKLIELAEVKVKINDMEYLLTETTDTEFVTGTKNENGEYIIQPLQIESNHINVEFISDTDNSCEIYDLMVNAGSVKLAYSQNQNETTTDTVNISKGITILSSQTNTKFKADSDGIRVYDKNAKDTDDPLTQFTDTGMKTKKQIVENEAEIVSVLIQRVGNQTWFTKI